LLVAAGNSGSRPLLALQLNGLIQDSDPEGRADRPFYQPDPFTMHPHQFGRNRQAEPDSSDAGRPWNASNKCSRAFVVRPGPVSETSSTTTAPSRRPVILI
jgi:hypothetical protein